MLPAALGKVGAPDAAAGGREDDSLCGTGSTGSDTKRARRKYSHDFDSEGQIFTGRFGSRVLNVVLCVLSLVLGLFCAALLQSRAEACDEPSGGGAAPAARAGRRRGRSHAPVRGRASLLLNASGCDFAGMSGNSSGNVGEDAPTGEECRRQVVYSPAAWERLFVVGLRKRRPDGRPWAAGCAGLQRNPLLASAWSNAASAQAGGTARMYKLPRGTGEHGSRMKPHGKAMSYFNTRVLCRGERPRMVVEPIEPLVGLPRGPVSACVMTSSPGGGADGAAGGAAGAAPGSIGLISHTLVGLPQGLPRGQRFFFDVGFGGYAHGGAGTPQRWFLERYARVLDVAFDRILIWGDGGGGAPPADEAPFLVTARSSHFALPAAEGLDSCNNPLNFVFQLCAPEDFVVLRLGAAAPTLAARLARDLAGDKRLAGLVDVLYYEDGPSAPAEPAPGEGDPGALADAMSTLARLRRMGVRAHSWV